ncbi:MAG: SprB repeat-containing protein [Lewinellaceae bacterium]|nr:SprB repeat-containing protein [Lewinellaceae bacterium]
MANASVTDLSANGANDGTATAAPTGGNPGYQYLWNTGSTSQSITNLPSGNYTVSVSDVMGCTAVQTVTVNEFGCSLGASITSTNVTCFGANNGTATVSITGSLTQSYIIGRTVQPLKLK